MQVWAEYDPAEHWAVFKFISLPNKLLIDLNLLHEDLLEREFGDNMFPLETMAVGSGSLEDYMITSLTFDYGDEHAQLHALEQIRAWARYQGFRFVREMREGSSEEQWTNFFGTAFVYYEGKLTYGPNHAECLVKLFNDEDAWQQYYEGGAHEGMVFGRLMGDDEIEIYSDIYEQDETVIDEAVEKLKKEHPERTKFTFGPDPAMIEEINHDLDKEDYDWTEVDAILKRFAFQYDPISGELDILENL